MNEAAWPNRSEAVLGLVLRANDSRADMWPGLSSMNQYDLGYALDYYAEFLPGMYDGREQAYGLARVSYCASVQGRRPMFGLVGEMWSL